MDGDSLVDCADQSHTRSDFVAFLGELLKNLDDHPDEWENDSLKSFLDAMRGFAEQAPGYYANLGESLESGETATWRGFANILLAAKVYE